MKPDHSSKSEWAGPQTTTSPIDACIGGWGIPLTGHIELGTPVLTCDTFFNDSILITIIFLIPIYVWADCVTSISQFLVK